MRNSVRRHLSTEIYSKGYFRAPAPDLINFKYGKDICPVCLETKVTFIKPPFGEYSKCCLDCLSKNDIRFTHDSEYGPVTSDELSPELEDIGDIKKHVSEKSIKELLITPEFTNIQGGAWKIHCNDFMIFRGIWEPSDFTENSNERNGKKLFMDMTDEESNQIWDEYELIDSEIENTWEDIQYYAFECCHCGKLRGYWDCS
jgi:uncharacterized protein CbrC (UPF0167 family)